MSGNKNGFDIVDGYAGYWRTVGGRRIHIRDGESLDTAMLRSGKFVAHPEKEYDKTAQFIGKIIASDKNGKVTGFKFKNRDILIKEELKTHILERRKEEIYNILLGNLKEIIYDYDEIIIKYQGEKISLIYVKKFGG